MFVGLGEPLLDNLIKLIELFIQQQLSFISSLSPLHSTCLLLENCIIRHSFIVVVESSLSKNRFGELLVLVVEDSFSVFWLMESDKSFEIFVPGLGVGIGWRFSKLKLKFVWIVCSAMFSPS